MGETGIRAVIRDRRNLAYRLAGEARVDWRTAERWILGVHVTGPADACLTAAAERLSVAAEVERYRSDAA